MPENKSDSGARKAPSPAERFNTVEAAMRVVAFQQGTTVEDLAERAKTIDPAPEGNESGEESGNE